MNIVQAASVFELNLDKEFRVHKSYEDAKKALPLFKQRIKKMFRQKCKQLHPDTGGSGDGAALSRLKEAYDLLMELNIRKQPRPQQVRIMVFNTANMSSFGEWTQTAFTGATASQTTGSYW